MKKYNFFEDLPEGYKEVYRLNAKSSKWSIIFTLGSLIMALAIILPCLLAVDYGGVPSRNAIDILIPAVVLIICIFAYIVLHELVHGIAYKALTGSKLTFGISLTVAFCGVPDIYVTRKTALIALLAPFTVFSVLFCALAVWLYFMGSVYYAVVIVLLGLHFGGCIGDLYTALLLFTKYSDSRLLMRDTGPEQMFYLPEDGNAIVLTEV